MAFNPKFINETFVASSLNIAQDSLIEEVNQAIINKDFEAMFSIANLIFQEGYQINYFLEQLISYFKNLLLNQSKSNNSTSNTNYSEDELLSILEFLGESSYRLKQTIFEKSFLEIVLIQLIKIHSSPSIKSFVKKLKSLEKEILDELSEDSNSSLKDHTNSIQPSKKIEQNKSNPIEVSEKNTSFHNTSTPIIRPLQETNISNSTQKYSSKEDLPCSTQKTPSTDLNHLNTNLKLEEKNSSTNTLTISVKKDFSTSLQENTEQKIPLSSEEKLQSDILMNFAAVEFNSTLIKD